MSCWKVAVNIGSKRVTDEEIIVDANSKWDAIQKATKEAAKKYGVHNNNVTANSFKTKPC